MTDRRLRVLALSACLASMVAWSSPAEAGFNVTNVGGSASTASIQGEVDAFRNALGANNGNASNLSGTLTGRREINWDGGGATGAAPTPSVFTGFTDIRGSTSSTPGTGFLQTPVTDAALTGINASYASTFAAFSPLRIFTPIASNITDVSFFVPGSNGAIPATVSAFGVIFSDVDLANTTRVEFFGLTNTQLLSANVVPGTVANASFSFFAAIANAGERIARVRITTGTGPLGPNDNPAGGVDMVVMDDFIYAEPAAVPEPASLAMVGLGLAGVGLLRRYRRRGVRIG